MWIFDALDWSIHRCNCFRSNSDRSKLDRLTMGTLNFDVGVWWWRVPIVNLSSYDLSELERKVTPWLGI